MLVHARCRRVVVLGIGVGLLAIVEVEAILIFAVVAVVLWCAKSMHKPWQLSNSVGRKTEVVGTPREALDWRLLVIIDASRFVSGQGPYLLCGAELIWWVKCLRAESKILIMPWSSFLCVLFVHALNRVMIHELRYSIPIWGDEAVSWEGLGCHRHRAWWQPMVNWTLPKAVLRRVVVWPSKDSWVALYLRGHHALPRHLMRGHMLLHYMDGRRERRRLPRFLSLLVVLLSSRLIMIRVVIEG